MNSYFSPCLVFLKVKLLFLEPCRVCETHFEDFELPEASDISPQDLFDIGIFALKVTVLDKFGVMASDSKCNLTDIFSMFQARFKFHNNFQENRSKNALKHSKIFA